MKCLLCYKPLAEMEHDYHTKCVMKLFGTKQIPALNFDTKKLVSYAKEILRGHSNVTGVQPKLSIWLEENKKNIRFTIVDGKSNYILKPQSETYTALPENEDLCMHLAVAFGIKTAQHGLVKFTDGSLAYITKRFDRIGKEKLACEDLCQLSETLTEHKDRGSYEKTGKTIRHFSTQAGLDAIHYFELVVFGFITANADMHLKNFSMLENEIEQFSLSPAYDLVCTALVIKNEQEQLMLTLNGRKNKITKKDFIAFAKSLMLTEKQYQTVFKNFRKKIDVALWWIDNCFLPDSDKEKILKILTTRIDLLNK